MNYKEIDKELRTILNDETNIIHTENDSGRKVLYLQNRKTIMQYEINKVLKILPNLELNSVSIVQEHKLGIFIQAFFIERP